MKRRSVRPLERLLDSDKLDERRAGLILVSNLGWSRAKEHWTRAVEYLLGTRDALADIEQAESLAVSQIVSSVEPDQTLMLEPTSSPGHMTTLPEGANEATRGAISRIAICGNPASGGATEVRANETILQCARVISRFDCTIVHGPRGSGIMVANLCHNQFQAKGVRSELVFVDRARIVGKAQLAIIIGGGFMTGVEADIAIERRRHIAPMPGTGGVADDIADRIRSGSLPNSPPKRILELVQLETAQETGGWLRRTMLDGLDAATS